MGRRRRRGGWETDPGQQAIASKGTLHFKPVRTGSTTLKRTRLVSESLYLSLRRGQHLSNS